HKGYLDPETPRSIMRSLEEGNARGTTIILATHSKEVVHTRNKRVIAIENGSIARDEYQEDNGYEIQNKEKKYTRRFQEYFEKWLDVNCLNWCSNCYINFSWHICCNYAQRQSNGKQSRRRCCDKSAD